jgi:putative selenate reductase
VAQLSPYPFGALVTRMFREYETRQRIFDLPAASFVLGDRAHDYTVGFHGRVAATPFGPAAGPHSQLAQNIVLSWLAGGRIIELKTVQANDRITIARPCIDARTVAFNVEWSQELTLEQSVEEYVKASMLIQMLAASGQLAMEPGFDRFVFDISIGYDLAGITSDRVLAFMRTMRHATAMIDRLRGEVPVEWRHLADLPLDSCIADSVTLSTFHGCPASEIERILEFLLRDLAVSAIVKLNPTLLGYEQTDRLLHDVLGYSDIRLSRDGFDADLTWDRMCGLVDRVARVADKAGRAFGVKLTNTLIVENDGDFLPASEPKKYLSGAPLHVIAMHLVRRFRREFGSRLPVSFSGGIDRVNFPDAVALGLTPITVCTDFLRPGGYARGRGYFHELAMRMDAVGARTIGEFISRAYGHESPVGDDVVVANTDVYVDGLAAQGRYTREGNSRPPRKIGHDLDLLDCLTCDKCVPVCPNDANFTFAVPPGEVRRETVWRERAKWRSRLDGVLMVTRPHQIGNFADLCNECGNCDVFCPEDGGPQHVKPRFFGSADAWRAAAPLDGFFLGASPVGHVMMGRIAGVEYAATFHDESVCYVGRTFAIEFDEDDPASTVRGEAKGKVDLTAFHLMNALRKAVLAVPGSNYVNCLP